MAGPDPPWVGPGGVQLQVTTPCPQAVHVPPVAELPQVTHFSSTAAPPVSAAGVSAGWSVAGGVCPPP